jgi:hypothetical protein
MVLSAVTRFCNWRFGGYDVGECIIHRLEDVDKTIQPLDCADSM